MILDQQVCSLELAKRLKELGVKQESYFWWRSPLAHYGYPEWSLSDGELGHGSESFSAFTAAELGEMLKEHVNGIQYGFSHGATDWHVYVEKIDDEIYADTEADARAKMLICLLENRIITV